MSQDLEEFPDTSDAYALYSYLQHQVERLPSPAEFSDQVMREFSDVWESPVSKHIRAHMRRFASDLYEYEQYNNIPPFPPDYEYHTLEGAQYRDQLIAKLYHIPAPDSTVDVIKCITTMLLTHFCDLIPPPYNEEIPSPDCMIPAIHKMRGLTEFITFLLDYFKGEKLRNSTHLLPRLRTALNTNDNPAALKLRTQAERDFAVSALDVVSAHFNGTPFLRLFQLRVPINVPDELKREHARSPIDPDHPMHHCYQCKRRLPTDFALQYWQELDFPKGPFFHAEHCRNTTLNRHRANDGEYIETYRGLMKEYNVFVRDYEQKRRLKEEEELRKQKEAQERREERDHQNWLRDQERAEATWEREQEKERKEQERLQKEREKVEETEAARLAELLPVRTSLTIPESVRFAGTWIIAPQGMGKTNLLAHLFDQDRTKHASIIVLDCKGELVNAIKSLRSISDRIILIEPDQKFPLALNPLHIPNATLLSTLTLVEYIFSALLEKADLTGLQTALLRNVIPPLLEHYEHPTLQIFRNLIELGSTNAIEGEFFEKQFNSSTYQDTRKQLMWRLDYLKANPLVRPLFYAKKTELDIEAQMDAGRIVVIDNAKGKLETTGSQFYGRFFLALIRAAAHRRSLRPTNKLPCYVYIDEAQNIISKDENVPEIIAECRSQNIALILAHQWASQIESRTVLSALTNCAVRYAHSDDDAVWLADKFRTSSDNLRNLPEGQFATFVRGMQPPTVALEIPFYGKHAFGDRPHLSEAEMSTLRVRMREKYAYVPETDKAPEGATTQPTGPMSSEHVSKPTQSEHSKKPDPSGAIEIDVTKRAPKSAPTPLDQLDPGEPSTDWKLIK